MEEMNERMKVSKPTVIHDLIWTWRFLRKNCGPQKFEREEHGKVTRECGKGTGEGTGQTLSAWRRFAGRVSRFGGFGLYFESDLIVPIFFPAAPKNMYMLVSGHFLS